jgi:hypothetical protein
MEYGHTLSPECYTIHFKVLYNIYGFHGLGFIYTPSYPAGRHTPIGTGVCRHAESFFQNRKQELLPCAMVMIEMATTLTKQLKMQR